MKRFIGVLVVATLTLVGCGGTGGKPTSDKPRGTNAPTNSGTPAPPAQDETPVADPADDSSSNDTAQFGKTYSWSDGLQVTVSEPSSYKPGEYAAGVVEGQEAVVFTVRIINGTGKVYEPVLFSTTLQSGNSEGSQIYDSGNGLGGSPTTKLLNGRESEFRIAFSVMDPTDLVLEVRPGFEYDSAIFTS